MQSFDLNQQRLFSNFMMKLTYLRHFFMFCKCNQLLQTNTVVSIDPENFIYVTSQALRTVFVNGFAAPITPRLYFVFLQLTLDELASP